MATFVNTKIQNVKYRYMYPNNKPWRLYSILRSSEPVSSIMNTQSDGAGLRAFYYVMCGTRLVAKSANSMVKGTFSF